MGVKRFAALPSRRADRNNFSGLLFDHVSGRKMNHRIHAFQIDANHFIPLLFRHFFNGLIIDVPHACVGNQNVNASQPRNGLVHKFLVVDMPANVGLERLHACSVFPRFALHKRRRVFRFVVVEHYVRAGLRE